MTEISLTYNNKEYVLNGLADTDLKITVKAGTVGDVKSIKTPVSRTLKIPKSAKNIKAFGNLGTIGAANYLAYNEASAKVKSNNIDIFSKAKVYARNKPHSYSCIFKEGAGNFFDEIEGLSIKDIDFSDLVENWNKGNIIAANANNDGLIYPIIDYGLGNTHTGYTACQEMPPAIFLSTIFERIFNQSFNPTLSKDYSLVSDISTDANYQTYIVPLTENNITDADIAKIEANRQDNADITSFPNIISFNGSGSDVIPVIISTDLNIVQSGTPVTRNIYNIFADGVFSFSSDVRVNIPSSGTITAILFQNTTELDSASITSSGITTLSATDIKCEKGDHIFVEVRLSSGGGEIKTPCTFACTNAEIEKTGFQLPFDIASNLPDISQMDFIKEVMSFFALIPDYDTKTNTIIFKKFSYITDQITSGNPRDLTGKLDITKIGTVDNVPNNYSFISLAKTNKMNWTNDDAGNIPAQSGQGQFELNGVNYKGEKSFITSVFSSSNMNFIFNQLATSIPVIPVFENVETVRTRVNEFKARILQVQKTTIDLDYSDDDGTTTTTETGNIPIAKILDWSLLKAEYYTEYISAINEPDTPIINIVFTALDFASFDKFQPVYFEELNGYYWCFELNFVPNNISTMKLLKLK